MDLHVYHGICALACQGGVCLDCLLVSTWDEGRGHASSRVVGGRDGGLCVSVAEGEGSMISDIQACRRLYVFE